MWFSEGYTQGFKHRPVTKQNYLQNHAATYKCENGFLTKLTMEAKAKNKVNLKYDTYDEHWPKLHSVFKTIIRT